MSRAPITPAEKESWRETVAYFWNDKGDPTRYVLWDEAYCEQVWPEFLHEWRQFKLHERIIDALVKAL